MADPTFSSSPKHIVVIGGGLAGCTAALEAARHNAQKYATQPVRVTLLESKSRLGGRVGSYFDEETGQWIDYCQHVGMKCCTALRELIDELGCSDAWQEVSELHFYGPGSESRTLRALPLLPAPAHLASWLWGWPGLTWRDRLGIALGMHRLNRLRLDATSAERLDRTSALEWLKSQRQSDRALDRFWNTVLVSALGEELAHVNLAAVAKVFQDGFLRRRDAFHLLVPQRPLKEIFGTEMHAALERTGVDVRLSQSVQRLEWNEGDSDSARCTAVITSGGERIEADRVILSVPWFAAAELLRDAPGGWSELATGWRSLSSSPISGVHTWWDRDWLPTPHAALVGRLCQWIFPAIGDAADHTQTYYQIVISASRSLPKDPDEQRRVIVEDLSDVFPQVKAAELMRLKAVTDPRAVFSVRPGTFSLRPKTCPVPGNVQLAGDWTQTGWPATMEGAIRSGRACSEAQ